MKLNFDILTALLFACENKAGKTIDDMKNTLDWETCSKQVQAIINYIIEQKFVTPLPHRSKGGERLPTRWVTSKHLRNANQYKAG